MSVREWLSRRLHRDRNPTAPVQDALTAIPPLRGETVTQVGFDSSVYLRLGDAGTIQIETPLVLTDAAGARSWAERMPLEVTGSLVDLLGGVVDDVAVTPTGHLAIVFADGRRIDVDADDRYEAWNFRGARGLWVICLPGGEVQVFDPVTPPSTG